MENISQMSLLEVATELMEQKRTAQNIYALIKEVLEMKGIVDEDNAYATQLYIDITTSSKFVYMGNDEWDLKLRQSLDEFDKDGSAFNTLEDIEEDEVEDLDEDDLYDDLDDFDDDEEEDMLERYGQGNRMAAVLDPTLVAGHQSMVDDIIDAVLEDRDPQIMPMEAIKAVRIINAVYESAKTGKTIYFD